MNDTDDIIVNKFALKYDPPTFVIEYTNESIDKSRIKLIRIKSPSSQSAAKLLQKLIAKYPDLLHSSKVDHIQVLSLLKQLLSHSTSPAVTTTDVTATDVATTDVTTTTVITTSKIGIKANEIDEIDIVHLDLNKVSDDVNMKAKSLMNKDFIKNSIKPGDAGFVYDVSKDFEPDESNEWDEDD